MYVSLDIKTTWNNLLKDSIVEISLLKFNSNTFKVIEELHFYINPWIIPHKDEISRLWIEEEDLLMAPYIDEVYNKIIDFIWDNIIIWFWTNSAIPFLNKSNYKFNNIILDLFSLANFLSFNEKSISLDLIVKNFDIKCEANIFQNCNYIILLLKRYIKEIQKLPNTKKEILKYILSKSTDTGLIYILDNFIDSKIILIDRTIYIKYILKKIKKVDKIKDIKIQTNVLEWKSKNILSNIKWLEVRKNQETMMDIIDNSLEENKLSLIEAPTGLWKTFSYLIPSIFYSIKKGEQIFISTTTKALQDQIFYKDLNFLKDNLLVDFTYSKLKWRSNYFWINSFLTFFYDREYFDNSSTSFILKISFWLLSTDSYELDELNYFWDEYGFLNEISWENKNTFLKGNIYENKEPSIIARKKAKKSNIVIINNSILFQDISWDNSILWNIKNLVLDESHNLEDVVTSSLKKSFTQKDIEKTFAIVVNILKKHKFNTDSFIINSEKIILNVGLVFNTLEIYLDNKIDYNSMYKNLLIWSDFYENDIDNFDLWKLSKSILLSFRLIIDLLKMTPDDLYIELSWEIRNIEKFMDIIDKVLDKKWDEKYIRTINHNKYNGLSIDYTHLNIWEFLSKNLWNKLNTCILTSATLSIEENFDYINKVLSLEKFNFTSLDSDFDYSKQSLLYVVNDLWSIKMGNDSLINFLREFISIVKGKTLVLLTAISIINKLYSNFLPLAKKLDINLLAQSITWWNNKILELYKKNSWNSVIFWTDTFWEGIDLPWDDLKYLVVHKIPFMVPSDPIFIARSKLFDDAFKDYSIPKAVIKLKQWFWRLIRTKNDKGIIIFLDNRITNTNWWDTLFNAFPDNINLKIWKGESLLKIL